MTKRILPLLLLAGCAGDLDIESSAQAQSSSAIVFTRTQAEGNAGDPFLQVIPDPDPGPSTQPPWEMGHERSLHGSTYNHVVKLGFNYRNLDQDFGRVWIAQEGNYETGDPNHPFSTEMHLSCSRRNGPEWRSFSAVCSQDDDYVLSGFVADKQVWSTTGGVSYLSLGATGFDLGSGFGVRKGTNNQTFLSQLNAAGTSFVGIALVNSADQVQIGPGQRAVLIDGTLSRGEVNLAWSATLTVNASQADVFRVGQMAGDMAIDLQGLQLGTEGRVFLRQAAAGGKRVTAITASDTGREVVMDAAVNPSTLNTQAFLAPGSLAVLRYAVTNAGGLPWVKVALEATVPVSYQ